MGRTEADIQAVSPKRFDRVLPFLLLAHRSVQGLQALASRGLSDWAPGRKPSAATSASGVHITLCILGSTTWLWLKVGQKPTVKACRALHPSYIHRHCCRPSCWQALVGLALRQRQARVSAFGRQLLVAASRCPCWQESQRRATLVALMAGRRCTHRCRPPPRLSSHARSDAL